MNDLPKNNTFCKPFLVVSVCCNARMDQNDSKPTAVYPDYICFFSFLSCFLADSSQKIHFCKKETGKLISNIIVVYSHVDIQVHMFI